MKSEGSPIGLTRVSITFAIGLALSSHVVGQTPSRLATSNAIPHVVDGHPDLQGLYNAATITPLERPDAFAGRPADYALADILRGARSQER